jgi:hypothetical protein
MELSLGRVQGSMPANQSLNTRPIAVNDIVGLSNTILKSAVVCIEHRYQVFISTGNEKDVELVRTVVLR